MYYLYCHPINESEGRKIAKLYNLIVKIDPECPMDQLYILPGKDRELQAPV